jgi:hemerythrin-like domain-containing protein
MKTIDTLRAEHDGVLAVLDQLERAVAAAAHGAPVPGSVFTDVQEFFVTFVDHCHHGKEEAEIFPRLEGGATGRLVARLDRDHDEGHALAARYIAAVGSYYPGDRVSGTRLAAAARDYAGFLRRHIELEDRELFPAIEAALAGADDELVAAFDRIEEDEIGPGTHERLHRMIDGLPGRIDPYVATPVGD